MSESTGQQQCWTTHTCTPIYTDIHVRRQLHKQHGHALRDAWAIYLLQIM